MKAEKPDPFSTAIRIYFSHVLLRKGSFEQKGYFRNIEVSINFYAINLCTTIAILFGYFVSAFELCKFLTV